MSIILSLDNKITEENNMSTKIKNVVNSFAFDKVVALLESGNIVTPQVLDAWEFRLYEIMQKHDQKIDVYKRQIQVQLVNWTTDNLKLKCRKCFHNFERTL